MNENKKIRDTLKEIMKENGYTIKDIAELLGRPDQTIRNKFSMDRFTFSEILLILSYCKYKMQFISDNCTYDISPDNYLDKESLDNLAKMKNKKIYGQLSLFDELLDDIDIPKEMRDNLLDELEEKIKRLRNEQ